MEEEWAQFSREKTVMVQSLWEGEQHATAGLGDGERAMSRITSMNHRELVNISQVESRIKSFIYIYYQIKTK